MSTRCTSIVLATCALVVTATIADAADTASPEQKGRGIAEEADRRDEGFGDSVVALTMTLSNAEGRTRTRRLTWRTLERREENEGDKSLVVFHEPRDIEGTAFLTFTHIGSADDQWLYLPSLKRVKRISSANKSSAFVGSEFSYEDLLSDEVEKFDYRWLRDEPCGELLCFVLERRPRYEDSGYARQVLWVDQGEYRTMRIDFFDLEERHLKTLTFEDYRRYRERYWRAHRMQMDNRLTEKRTLLEFDPFEFGSGLTERDFDPGALTRLR
ncbi:MAG: outer membrane lipoprotein-sorting protein [Gammaproteobacteria bacterium]